MSLPSNLEGETFTDSLAEAVEEGNPDRLLRLVNRLCGAGSWDGLLDLRSRCLHAVERGKQLWAVAEHIEYRLALEAPGAWAGPMVVEGAGRFTLGPLPEVAASRHTWMELAPHLPEGPSRSVTAHERVVRGEDLTGADGIDPHILEIPLRLSGWEPRYPNAEYAADKADFPMPSLPRMTQIELSSAAEPVEHPESSDALLSLTRAWTEESNGRSEAAAVHGDAIGAIRGLGLRRALISSIDSRLAVSLMAWAGASGGAYGRRRGAAAGRFAAWWTLAALTDLLEGWPVPTEQLGEASARLQWYAWSDLAPPTGWTLHLAVEDARRGMAWAIAAVDAK